MLLLMLIPYEVVRSNSSPFHRDPLRCYHDRARHRHHQGRGEAAMISSLLPPPVVTNIPPDRIVDVEMHHDVVTAEGGRISCDCHMMMVVRRWGWLVRLIHVLSARYVHCSHV